MHNNIVTIFHYYIYFFLISAKSLFKCFVDWDEQRKTIITEFLPVVLYSLVNLTNEFSLDFLDSTEI